MEYKQFGIEIKDIDQRKRLVTAIVGTSDMDDGGDIILPGAYKDTIVSNFKRIKMLWQHKSDTPIGRPVHIEQMPDGKLLTESYVSKIQKGEDYLTLADEEIVTEFSIGYTVKESEYRDDGGRNIKSLELFEYSPVTWGMNKNTQLLAIKSADDLKNIRELERVLRDVGYSHKEAKVIASNGMKGLREVGKEQEEISNEQELKALADAIESFNLSLRGK